MPCQWEAIVIGRDLSPIVPDLDDVPEDDEAEPDDAETTNPGSDG